MLKKTLNICQVSLDNNIPLIIENFLNLKKIYDEVRVFVLCPEKQLKNLKKNFLSKKSK